MNFSLNGYFMNNTNLIERLKKAADVAEDQALAEILGMSKSAFSYAKKNCSFSIGLMIDFSSRYNCDLNWLLTGESVGIKLDPLENLLLTAFNKLDDDAKISVISLLHTGGKNASGISQTSGDNGSNNIFSGDNVTINAGKC